LQLGASRQLVDARQCKVSHFKAVVFVMTNYVSCQKLEELRLKAFECLQKAEDAAGSEDR